MNNNTKQFRVVFKGKVAKKFSRDQVSVTLGKMIGKSPASLAPIFAGEQKISFSKKPLDFQTAVKLKAKLLRLGLVTDIQPWKTASDDTPPTHRSTPSPTAVAEKRTESATPSLTPDDSSQAEEPDTEVSIAVTKPKEAATPEALTNAEPSPTASAQQTAEADSASEENDEVPVTNDDASTVETATAVLLERLEEPPNGVTIVNADEDGYEEASTSETIFHEHPYLQPWWKRIISWRTSGIILLLIAWLGYWAYTLTTFTASSAAQVIENHLATKNLSMIGLIDVDKLKATARWMDIDAEHFRLPVDLAYLDKLNIDVKTDVYSIVISQHDTGSEHPTTMVLLGQFDEEKIRAAIETQLNGVRAEDNKNRLVFTAEKGTDCRQELGIQIDHNEIILTSADFVTEAYRLIHESFDGKPAMLKTWREYRQHHPVSFNIIHTEGLSENAEAIVEGIITDVDLAGVEEIMLGIDTAKILIGDAVISILVRSSHQAMLDKTAKALETSSLFGKPSRLEVMPGRIELEAPLTQRNVNPALLRQHSLLGLCPN